MKISKNTVSRWLSRYKEQNNVTRKNGSGRKNKLSKEHEKYILDEISKDGNLNIFEIKNNMKKIYNGISVCNNTIRNTLIKNNKIYRKPIFKPYLSDKHKRERINWAKEYMYTDWSKVIFSDPMK